MEEKCLAFFQERSKEPLELFNVKQKIKYLEFTIQNPGKSGYGHTCVTLKIQRDLSLMEISLVTKCSLSGTQNIENTIQFAKENLIQMIELLDVSAIDYTLFTKEIGSISLKQISMLEKGYSFYERFGFKNNFDPYRDVWIMFTQQPFTSIYSQLDGKVHNDLKELLNEHKGYFRDPSHIHTYTGLTIDAPIFELCKQINVFLKKNCPKDRDNTCNSSIYDRDFVFLSGFVEKSFQLLSLLVLLESGIPIKLFRELESVLSEMDVYYLLLLPIGASVVTHGLRTESMNGLKGKITDIKNKRYTILFEDKRIAAIKPDNVKLLEVGGKRKTRKYRKRSNKKL